MGVFPFGKSFGIGLIVWTRRRVGKRNPKGEIQGEIPASRNNFLGVSKTGFPKPEFYPFEDSS